MTPPSNRAPESVRRSAPAQRRLLKVTQPPSETPEQHQFATVAIPARTFGIPSSSPAAKWYPSGKDAHRANLSRRRVITSTR